MRVLACAAFAWSAAAQVSVRLEAEINPVTANEVFSLVVTTEGASPEGVDFPRVPGIVIDTTPSMHSSNMKVVGRQVTQQVTVKYLAKIAEPGTIELPPATVTVDGQLYETNALTITAVKAEERAGPTLDDGIRLESYTDKTEVYEGEPVLLTLEVWELEQVSVRGISEYPTTVGFLAVPQEPVAQKPDTRQFEGLRYRVRPETQMLYPTRSGTLQIGPFRWRGQVLALANVGGIRRRVYEDLERGTDSIVLEVKPLPERPAGFNGSVGSYLVQGALSSDQIKQGVPVKLAIHIVGTGNPRALSAPDPPFLEWAHVGEPVRIDAAPEKAIEGRVDQYFEYALTPHTAGEQTVPRIQFVYFDPAQEVYETKGIGPFALTVTPSGETERPVVFDASEEPSAASIDILATDILPIVMGNQDLSRGGGVPWWFWAAAALPVCAYAAGAGYVLRRRRFDRDHVYARAYRARSEAHKELGGVLGARRPEEALHRALIHYIAHTFNAPDAGMTAQDAERVLDANGVGEDLRRNVQTILRKCERAVYASQRLPEDEMRALVHGAAAVIDQTKGAGKRGKS